MAKIFVYGDITCRGDVEMKRTTLDSDLVLEYVSNCEAYDKGKKTDEDMDKFMDSMKWDTAEMVGLFSDDYENGKKVNPRTLYNRLIKGKSFYLMGEESLYGYGLTKEAAMIAYAKGQSENSDFDDDGEDW